MWGSSWLNPAGEGQEDQTPLQKASSARDRQQGPELRGPPHISSSRKPGGTWGCPGTLGHGPCYASATEGSCKCLLGGKARRGGQSDHDPPRPEANSSGTGHPPAYRPRHGQCPSQEQAQWLCMAILQPLSDIRGGQSHSLTSVSTHSQHGGITGVGGWWARGCLASHPCKPLLLSRSHLQPPSYGPVLSPMNKVHGGMNKLPSVNQLVGQPPPHSSAATPNLGPVGESLGQWGPMGRAGRPTGGAWLRALHPAPDAGQVCLWLAPSSSSTLWAAATDSPLCPLLTVGGGGGMVKSVEPTRLHHLLAGKEACGRLLTLHSLFPHRQMATEAPGSLLVGIKWCKTSSGTPAQAGGSTG